MVRIGRGGSAAEGVEVEVVVRERRVVEARRRREVGDREGRWEDGGEVGRNRKIELDEDEDPVVRNVLRRTLMDVVVRLEGIDASLHKEGKNEEGGGRAIVKEEEGVGRKGTQKRTSSTRADFERLRVPSKSSHWFRAKEKEVLGSKVEWSRV